MGQGKLGEGREKLNTPTQQQGGEKKSREVKERRRTKGERKMDLCNMSSKAMKEEEKGLHKERIAGRMERWMGEGVEKASK